MGQCRKRHPSLLPTLWHVAPPKWEGSGKCHLILGSEGKGETRMLDAGECRCLCHCEISTQASWLLGASSTFTWTAVARKLTLLSSPKYTLSLPVAVLSSGDKQVSATGVSNTHHSGNKIVPVNYLDSQTLAVHYFLWCFDRNTGIPRFIALHFFALHK